MMIPEIISFSFGNLTKNKIMNKDFEKEYFELDSQNQHWWLVVRRKIVEDLLGRFAPHKDDLKILDFGCSSGEFVRYIQKLNYNVFGCDVSKEAIEKGQQKGILNLSVVRDNHLDYSSESFDVVLALDVIEHLEEEGPAVKEIFRVLKKGGLFVVFVPAYQFLWGIEDETSHHYRRYSSRSLLGAIQNSADFTVVKKSYFNTFLFLPIAFVKILGRIIKTGNRKSDLELNNSLLNYLFFNIFNFERKLLKRLSFPFGASLLLVLRKGSL